MVSLYILCIRIPETGIRAHARILSLGSDRFVIHEYYLLIATRFRPLCFAMYMA